MFYHIRQNRVPYLEIKLEMAKNPHFFVSFRPLLLFLPCILCIFFFFFVLLLPLILLLPLLLLNDQIANFFGAFILFKVNNSVFSYVNKNFGNDPLFCCVIHELRPKRKGSSQKLFTT